MPQTKETKYVESTNLTSLTAPADRSLDWPVVTSGVEIQSAATFNDPFEDEPIDTKLTYDLPALVDLALRTNPETRISWESAKAAAARLERKRSAWYPTLTAMAFGQYYKVSYPISHAPLISQGFSSLASLNLAWTLFDFGRRQAAIDTQAQRLVAANFAFNRKHQEIAYRVAAGFFAYQAALARVTAAQQTLATATASYRSVETKFNKGLATRPELLLAIQEQAKARYDLQDARGSAAQSRADLYTNLGISPSYSLQLIDLNTLPLPEGLGQSVEKIVDQALVQHPDLMQRLAELRAREAEIKQARAEFWPKISLGGSIGNQYWGNVYTSPNEGNYSTNIMVGAATLSVEWTLFDGYERQNAVREAEARKKRSQARFETLRLQIIRDIWKAYADTKTAMEKREFALALLKAAKESYRAAKKSYTYGLSTVIQLMSAQKDLARARYTEIDSRAALLHAAAGPDICFRGTKSETIGQGRTTPS